MQRASRLALALVLLAWLLAPAAWAGTDLRIQLNPALADLYAKDPGKAEAVLDALGRIVEGRSPPSEAPATRSIENPEHRRLIEGNPLIEEAWRIDPKAALDQLREIVAAGSGG
jgi:hypothetical protein